MDKTAIDFYTRLARGLAAQFGSNCEIVIHDLESNDVEHSIVAIENGYITGRKLGDGPSHIVLESLQNGAKHTHDKLAYLTKTKDGNDRSMIKIITVGKIKEKYLTDAINEYLKRLSKYTKINLIEVPDENFDITKTLETEKKSILKYVSEKDYVITMEIEGKELSSIEFARKIDEIQISNSNICFIIGGSYGLSDEIKKMSNFKLSFSKMTFPHQLFRLILLEQIYRAFKIANNETYHK